MTLEPRWKPPPPTSTLEGDLERLLGQISAGSGALGEKLLIIGRGRPPIPGAVRGAVAVASDGDLALILALDEVDASAAPAIADQLDRLATVTESGLEMITSEPLSAPQLEERRRRFFSETVTPGESLPRFNASQRVLLVVGQPLSTEAWRSLVIELGPMLGGVWLLGETELRPLEVPSELLKRPRDRSGVPLASVIGGLIVLVGIGLGVVALTRERPEPAVIGSSAAMVDPPVRDVAFEVPADATHSQWIGQQRMLRTSDGMLVVLYPTPGGLQIVSDQKNQGRSWRSPVSYPQISPRSLSATIDAKDNLHIAFSDESGVSYASMQARARGWKAPEVLVIDEDSTSPVVDIDWDPVGQRAYIVWAAQTEDGEAPRWGILTEQAGIPQLLRSGELAGPGDDIDVLVNIAVGPRGFIQTSYRRGDTSLGWFGRTGQIGTDGLVEWGVEERLSSGQGFGAASLAVDPRGAAHLVLRDSTSYALLYFRKARRGGWSSPQTAVDAEATEQIDLPMLSLDASSKLVYLFFQTNEFNPENEIGLAIRDPAGGWEDPYRIAPTSGGALYPTTMALTAGQPITLWTKGGAAPTIQAARVIAP